MNKTIETIQNHRSIRAYLDKKVPNEMLEHILKSIQAMPTSINGQQVSVIVVKDKERRAEFAEIAGGQPWIAKAPVFLVFVADFYKSYLAGEKTGMEQVIHESVEGSLVGSFDGGLAMGAAIISAESLGLGIVPIGGIRRNPQAVIDLLELPKYTYPLAGLCIGYPEDTSKKKPRMPKATFVHQEKYNKADLKEEIDKYDEIMEPYLEGVGRGSEKNWTTWTSGVYKQVYFPLVHPTMKSQGFLNDK
jgi:FMN reductase [NAD(P)H]